MTVLIWITPPNEFTKFYWDAASNPSLKRMGIGVVARDEDGKVIAAIVKVFPYVGDPLTAEAMGAWQSVLLGSEVGCSHMLLEGDSLTVISALQQNVSCWSSVGQLIKDTRQGLRQFQAFRVNHVKREAN
jgi:hypothetical protein